MAELTKPPTEAEIVAQKKARFIEHMGLEDDCIGCWKRTSLVSHGMSEDRKTVEFWYVCKLCGYKQGIRAEGGYATTYDALFNKIDETVRGSRTEDKPLS